MKISAKTLNAASKAAKARGMSLDKWAEQILAEAAAGARQPSNIEARLREISKKLDRLADRQGLGEKANEQLAGAVRELGASYNRARKSTKRAMSEAETRASSTAEDLTTKASELLERVRKSAGDLLGPTQAPSGEERESTVKPTKPAAKPNRSRAKKSTKSVGAASRRSTSSNKKNEKPRGSQRRRSQAKSKPGT